MAGVDGFQWMWLGFSTVIVRVLQVCDLGGLFFFFRLLVVMRLWVWVCDFGGWGLWLWEVVAMAFVVAMVAAGWWFFFFFFGGGGLQWLAVGVAMAVSLLE